MSLRTTLGKRRHSPAPVGERAVTTRKPIEKSYGRGGSYQAPGASAYERRRAAKKEER